MRTVIVGAGEVGFHIADKLSSEGHDVVIIEKHTDRGQRLRATVDAQVIEGSGAHADVLEEAGVAEADLFIAVTESDEVNLVACLIASRAGANRVVCRVSQGEFVGFGSMFDKRELGIDLLISPHGVVAADICQLVGYEEASEAAEFAQGRVVFLGHPIEAGSPVAGVTLKQLGDIRGIYRLVVTAILRDGQTIMPRGDDQIEVGDVVYFVCKKQDLPAIRYLFGDEEQKTKDKDLVFVLGGGRVGLEVAATLGANRSVKILERSASRARRLAEELDTALILHSDAMDIDTLRSENVGKASVFISVTDDDKTNILAALLAKKEGARRAICLVNQPEMLDLAPSLGIDVCISPRLATATAILKHLRSDSVLETTTLEESHAEVMELMVHRSSKAEGKLLRDLHLPEGTNLGAIVRGDDVLIPQGDDELRVSDHVIVFALPEAVAKVEKLFLAP